MKQLLRLFKTHLSPSQMIGFALANLVGSTILLLSIQLYRDILPIFDKPDDFMAKNYVVIAKTTESTGLLSNKQPTFSTQEINELKKQPFTSAVGSFSTSRFKVYGAINLGGMLGIQTELFFESVPPEFLDFKLKEWHFDPETDEIPIVLPKSYLNLYNLGYAQARNLPQITEEMMGLITIEVTIAGNNRREQFHGKVVGLTNRLNTLLVPQEFLNHANSQFAPKTIDAPLRLIAELTPASEHLLTEYLDLHHYETEQDNPDNSKFTFFLRIIATTIAAIGLIISALAFLILLLSIFLLIQKNQTKLLTLKLLGFRDKQIALPYQLLSLFLNTTILLLSLLLVLLIRPLYIDQLYNLWIGYMPGTITPMILTTVTLWALFSLLHLTIIRRKIASL